MCMYIYIPFNCSSQHSFLASSGQQRLFMVLIHLALLAVLLLLFFFFFSTKESIPGKILDSASPRSRCTYNERNKQLIKTKTI